MMRVRPARMSDLDRLVDLASSASKGLTTLPANRDLLEARITESIEAFGVDIDGPGGESYFMVLEDTANGKVAGTCAIYAGVGLSKAFYNYKILKLTQYSHELNVTVTSRLLTLVNDYQGATEVGTLYLDPDYRKDGNGQLLARSRYLLMGCFKERFSEMVMAEMRGWQDENGKSPLWEALGSHFFNIPFPDADYISGVGNNQFIADLMPKYPIYIEMLPKAAQDVIGKTHDETRPALNLLKKEGFRFSNAVDIFDGGPCVDVRLDDIRTIRHSKIATIRKIVDRSPAMERHLACTLELSGYQASWLYMNVVNGTHVDLDRDQAEILGLRAGDQIRFVTD
ncbi:MULTISPECIES: arginine N-succinyltransferase [Thalassospira]|uniref:arginine N-succinyltransferase n=1 Tax=Thalassospira TaxID=168934 RepID=UPI0008DCC246|nr:MULTISPECIES: arginine N-succinyltransferase [Thalassospira]MAB35204.1 arginine N-succinyltransferase [Thalassospira sp.]MDM7977024.1 arginine N-succinyltransferase [Thalassospira xiamenensis]OHY99377.1 arginine N-succinyltransferase [Thalassospira sp. MIT1004]HBS23206.1 arginine N-succinyltransferase [Thalassospira sp.]